MNKHYNNIMLLLLLLFGFSTSSAQNEKNVQAKIKIVQADNLVSIYATALNNSTTLQDNLSYSILSLKKGPSGNMSKNAQSGAFSLMPNENKTLSSQKVNIDPNGKIDIYLFIKRDDKVISKDTLSLGVLNKKYDNKPLQEAKIEISGLIIENVMTKPGRDFYDFFSQSNRTNQISYPFVIVINEKPALGGRNSEITILVNDEVVFRFNTQPKEEYLKMAVYQANRAIYNYNVKRKLLYKNEKLF